MFDIVESLYQDLSTIYIDKVVAYSRNYYKVYFLLDFLIQSLILTTAAPFIQGLYETIGKSYCVRHIDSLRLSCCCGPQSLPYSQPTRLQLCRRLDSYSVSRGDTLITSALMRPGRNNAMSRPSLSPQCQLLVTGICRCSTMVSAPVCHTGDGSSILLTCSINSDEED